MQQLAGQDAAFLYVENESLKTHFTLLMIYDQSALKKPLRYRDILAYFDVRMAGMPVFRRKLFPVPFDLDAPYFADDSGFNIEAHLRHVALPKPGDWRQFCILAAQIQAVPIDRSKPLWDMHVIEGLDTVEGIPPGSFAILTRLHHAIADGTTARGIMMALNHPAGKAPPPLSAPGDELPPSLAEMALRGMQNNARQLLGIPLRVARIVPGAGPALAKVAALAFEKLFADDSDADGLDSTDVPKTVFNGDMEYRRVFQLRRYPLEAIKRMRELAPGSTLNDVVLSMIGGGLKRYLAAQGEKHDVDLMALCPVNLREDKLTNASQLGNNISLMQVNLNTRTADPGQRLARVLAATTAAKVAQKASTAKELIELSKNAPNLLLAAGSRLAIRAAFRKGAAVRLSNCIITNVPGPQEPLYFMGARLELFTGVAPISPGTGITFPVSSYCGELCVSFTACPGWVEDPQQLARCLDQSFDEMLDALPATGKQARAAAGKPARPAAQRRPSRRR